MPRWPSQSAAEPAAKRARKNAVKEPTTAVPPPDPHQSIAEALSGAADVPDSVREMLCAGLGGCLASIGAKGGKAIARHPFQDRILGAVVDALEVAEASVMTEVTEAQAALKASQSEMATCEEAKKVLELGLGESSQDIAGREKALEENAGALEKARYELGVAESALRQTDTEIGQAAMKSHQISQVVRLVTSLSEKGAPDGEAAKFLQENSQLVESFPKQVATTSQDTEQLAVHEPVAGDVADESALGQSATEQSVSEEKPVESQPPCDQSLVEQSKDEPPSSEQLAEQLSRFSNCITDLEGLVSRTAEARILRVGEVDSSQSICSDLLTKRADQSAELREVKHVHRQREVSMKSNAKDLKQIMETCDMCVESHDSAQERLTELQQGPLSTCKCAVSSTTEVKAATALPKKEMEAALPKKDMEDLSREVNGNVEMRVELIQAGC